MNIFKKPNTPNKEKALLYENSEMIAEIKTRAESDAKTLNKLFAVKKFRNKQELCKLADRCEEIAEQIYFERDPQIKKLKELGALKEIALPEDLKEFVKILKEKTWSMDLCSLNGEENAWTVDHNKLEPKLEEYRVRIKNEDHERRLRFAEAFADLLNNISAEQTEVLLQNIMQTVERDALPALTQAIPEPSPWRPSYFFVAVQDLTFNPKFAVKEFSSRPSTRGEDLREKLLDIVDTYPDPTKADKALTALEGNAAGVGEIYQQPDHYRIRG
jgi:hypothetical protein